MSRNKGFTLVELLAVVIIIGLLSVIIVPKISNIYKNASEEIFVESANSLVKAFDDYYVKKNIGADFLGCEYNFSDGSGSCSDFSFTGTKPSGGIVSLSKDGKVNGYVVLNEFVFGISNGSVSLYDSESNTETEYTFSYTGASQTFTASYYGNYKIELWGAAGGESAASFSHVSDSYGLGGYTSGVIYLNKGDNLYVFVGQKGYDAALGSDYKTLNAYNGGGAGVGSADNDDAGGSGGGATDVRLVNGLWNNFDSLLSRIMVAGGGAGANVTTRSDASERGGHAGGLTGVGTLYRWQDRVVSDLQLHATQVSGYKLGAGQDAVLGNAAAGSGAGGGYYGGLTQQDTSDYSSAGGGGSSYISGYDGCNSVSLSSTMASIVHTNSPVHYSGKVFSDSVMKAGNESMPSYDGNSSMVGNDGNGYVKITYLGLGG